MKCQFSFHLEPQCLPKYLFTGIKNEKGYLEESYVDSNILLGIFISSINRQESHGNPRLAFVADFHDIELFGR